MADFFTVNLPGNWQLRWPEVQRAAKRYNFKVNRSGDDIDFNGLGVSGNIRVTGNTAHVTIDRKPFFISKSIIVRKVRDFLTKYA